MKLTYDRGRDTLCIRFNSFPIIRSTTTESGATFDFGDRDRLVAIEIADASFQIGEPCTVQIGNQISHFALSGE